MYFATVPYILGKLSFYPAYCSYVDTGCVFAKFVDVIYNR